MSERRKLAGFLREYIAGADGDRMVKVPTEYLRWAAALLCADEHTHDSHLSTCTAYHRTGRCPHREEA